VDWLGKQAVDNLKSFDLFGRRRLFTEPTYEAAVKYAAEHVDEYDEPLTIKKALKAMYGSIERQGKNHPFQSGNCSVIKLAMGSGSDAQGRPYMWSELPKYKARYIGMVHDELKIRVLKSNGADVAKMVADAILRAGATKMRRVKMESEYAIAPHWAKP
jgi:DNA polymerase I-like protein with 3'-5' exonuclease and polymerase domains